MRPSRQKPPGTGLPGKKPDTSAINCSEIRYSYPDHRTAIHGMNSLPLLCERGKQPRDALGVSVPQKCLVMLA